MLGILLHEAMHPRPNDNRSLWASFITPAQVGSFPRKRLPKLHNCHRELLLSILCGGEARFLPCGACPWAWPQNWTIRNINDVAGAPETLSFGASTTEQNLIYALKRVRSDSEGSKRSSVIGAMHLPSRDN